MIMTLKYKGEATIDIFIADSYFKRLIGYMFRKQPHHSAILFTPCNNIHTFFMKFNIDVLFLDEHMQVIKKIESLRPGKVVTMVMGAKMVIESEEGILAYIKEGDTLDLF